MTPKIDEHIIRCILKAEDFGGVSRVGVFGSFARAEQTENSDIDILYDYYYKNDSDNGINDTFGFLENLEADLMKKYGNRKVDFTSYQGLLDSDNIDLKQGVLRDVVWIYNKKGQ
jgi:predicted nucleotidyltransferase